MERTTVRELHLNTSALIKNVAQRAVRAGVPYQRFIRLTLEQAIGGPK
jgi:predicted DNA binding CopG/RHH family protein